MQNKPELRRGHVYCPSTFKGHFVHILHPEEIANFNEQSPYWDYFQASFFNLFGIFSKSSTYSASFKKPSVVVICAKGIRVALNFI